MSRPFGYLRGRLSYRRLSSNEARGREDWWLTHNRDGSRTLRALAMTDDSEGVPRGRGSSSWRRREPADPSKQTPLQCLQRLQSLAKVETDMDNSEKVPKTMREKYDEITTLTDAFCTRHLNDDYAKLVRQATAALARKRPSPLARGKAAGWACGVTHAIGMVNFLFDPSQTPHLKAGELYAGFGVSQSSGAQKSKQVRDVLNTFQMDPNWCLPGLIEDNPLAWLLELNGFAVDARTLPRELQEEAFDLGLIPYLPAERKPGREVSTGQARCSLCGAADNLTKTPCCDAWICDDGDRYVLFSYARNSCYRNHDRYTLCSFHFHEGHEGRWQDCEACRANFDIEDYVEYGTNEYNFEVLANPPSFEPTRCAACGTIIERSAGGYSQSAEGFFCGRCTAERLGKLGRSG